MHLNRKTRLYKNTNNFIFLGRNNCGNYARYRNVKRKLKARYHLYQTGKIKLNSFSSSLICYNTLCNKRLNWNKKR